jgi:protein-S-isoprenylcysteine O-methyltransferase Ste14
VSVHDTRASSVRTRSNRSGFLFRWPTLLTLLMFPMLVWMYVRLAWREEREVRAECGDVYACYAAATPAFVPRLRRAVQRRA